jgi:putative spermidine/putrescine transport system ATP-binding protein
VQPVADDAGTGTVATMGFLGPVSRVTVSLADGTLVLAQLPSSEAAGLGIGQRVCVSADTALILVVTD